MSKIKNLHDLGTDLLEVYEELRAGQIEPKTADALANVAGKVIGSLKVQLEYNVHMANVENKITSIQLLETSHKQLKAS